MCIRDSGGRDDDLFGRAVDPSNRVVDRSENKNIPKYPSYMTKIPWNLKFAIHLHTGIHLEKK